MKSYIAKPADIDHKWYIIDAEDKTLGKVAAEIAIPRFSITPIHRPPRAENRISTRPPSTLAANAFML